MPGCAPTKPRMCVALSFVVQLEEAAVAAREAATLSLLRELEAEEAQRAKKVRASICGILRGWIALCN